MILPKCCLLASLLISLSNAFLVPSIPALSIKVQNRVGASHVGKIEKAKRPFRSIATTTTTLQAAGSAPALEIVEPDDDDSNTDDADDIADSYTFFGVATATVWTAVSLIVLSHHPDPKFVNCSMKHNILTMSQALAFPLPVLWCVFASLEKAAKVGWKRLGSATYQRLNLGLVVSSVWLAFASGLPGPFAFGYDLIPSRLKISAAAIYASSAFLGLQVWKRSDGKMNLADSIKTIFKKPVNMASTLYSVACAGLLGVSVLPMVASYPLVTIPSILGKRLARPASGFYFLAAVASYCIKDAADRDRLDASTFKTLRKGLAIGSGLHLFLIALKLIGIDDGGLLLPGRGLWEVYPAMMAVPFAAGASFALHALLIIAATL